MPNSGYKWLDLLIALFVFLVIVWAILQVAGMIFDETPAAAIRQLVPSHFKFRIG